MRHTCGASSTVSPAGSAMTESVRRRIGRRPERGTPAVPSGSEESSQPLLDQAEAIAAIEAVLRTVVRGELEPRIGRLQAAPELVQLADHVDALLDLVDAFVREAATALEAALDGRYHRQILTRGLPGVFGQAAQRINAAQARMQQASTELVARDAAQEQIAETAKGISAHVAGAATELGASAEALKASAAAAVAEADQAMTTVTRLAETSRHIDNATQLIGRVAAQTRLLALNATIEAARAGDAGRGFAVVAKEVKDLADETARSSEEITHQVQAANDAAHAAGHAISAISGVIREVDVNVAGISEAAGGQGGLSSLAELLHREIGRIGS